MMETGDKNDNFYRAFEDRFRGSQIEIRKRLEAYGPFLDAILPYSSDKLALDIGCGRGEWLELIRDRGFTGYGVDLDERMLAASRERNLNVERIDAIEALSAVKDDTLSIVSGFHIAEHLPFEKLQSLISEALRALQPGGLLILETPNPENLKVSSHTFHLDPTHQKPLPPSLLQFMTQYYGFTRSKIVRLQENPLLSSSPSVTVTDALFGVSPDYAVVAQKAASPEILAPAEAVFARAFGVSDEELMRKFEDFHQQLLNTVENQGRMLDLMHNSFWWKTSEYVDRSVSRIRRSLDLVRTWLEFRPGSVPRRIVQLLLTHAMLWVRNRPRLARSLLKILQLAPRVQHRVIMAAQARGMALSFHSLRMPAWHLDVEPEVIEKWEELRKQSRENR